MKNTIIEVLLIFIVITADKFITKIYLIPLHFTIIQKYKQKKETQPYISTRITFKIIALKRIEITPDL